MSTNSLQQVIIISKAGHHRLPAQVGDLLMVRITTRDHLSTIMAINRDIQVPHHQLTAIMGMRLRVGTPVTFSRRLRLTITATTVVNDVVWH
jgi:hypothetical protein